jgi:hypothetical protein
MLSMIVNKNKQYSKKALKPDKHVAASAAVMASIIISATLMTYRFYMLYRKHQSEFIKIDELRKNKNAKLNTELDTMKYTWSRFYSHEFDSQFVKTISDCNDPVSKYIFENLPKDVQNKLTSSASYNEDFLNEFAESLNTNIVSNYNFFNAKVFKKILRKKDFELSSLIKKKLFTDECNKKIRSCKGIIRQLNTNGRKNSNLMKSVTSSLETLEGEKRDSGISNAEIERLNRRLLEDSYPDIIAKNTNTRKSIVGFHTYVQREKEKLLMNDVLDKVFSDIFADDWRMQLILTTMALKMTTPKDTKGWDVFVEAGDRIDGLYNIKLKGSTVDGMKVPERKAILLSALDEGTDKASRKLVHEIFHCLHDDIITTFTDRLFFRSSMPSKVYKDFLKKNKDLENDTDWENPVTEIREQIKWYNKGFFKSFKFRDHTELAALTAEIIARGALMRLSAPEGSIQLKKLPTTSHWEFDRNCLKRKFIERLQARNSNDKISNYLFDLLPEKIQTKILNDKPESSFFDDVANYTINNVSNQFEKDSSLKGVVTDDISKNVSKYIFEKLPTSAKEELKKIDSQRIAKKGYTLAINKAIIKNPDFYKEEIFGKPEEQTNPEITKLLMKKVDETASKSDIEHLNRLLFEQYFKKELYFDPIDKRNELYARTSPLIAHFDTHYVPKLEKYIINHKNLNKVEIPEVVQQRLSLYKARKQTKKNRKKNNRVLVK